MIIQELTTRDSIKKKKSLRSRLSPYLFILPHMLFFLVFVCYPFFFSLYSSFFTFDDIHSFKFVGFDNYIDILTPNTIYNKAFVDGLLHTLLFTGVMVPLLILVPLFIAFLLYKIKNTKIRSVFQVILYSSSVLSVSTVVWIWIMMFDVSKGLINNLFNLQISWRSSQPSAWIGIFILTLWSGIGGNMILFLSAISGISKSQFEAANLDGANGWHTFWRIVVPSLKFPITYATVMGIIGGFNVYGQPLLFGGPNGSYETIMMNIQDYAFGSTPMKGMASAMTILLGLIIIAVSLFSFKIEE